MSLIKYEYEVLMESGIIHKVYTFDSDAAIDAANNIKTYGPDHVQAYRKVGTTEWIVY